MILGVDVGGTFTDLVAINETDGAVLSAKTSTTPEDPSKGILTGIGIILKLAGAQRESMTELVHGTTLVANALIERKGAQTGLITTKGFRDILEIGRETRFDIYDMAIRRPEPLVERWRRATVSERLDAEGGVVEPLDETQAMAVADGLIRGGVESIAICLMHSWANPSHEKAIRDRVKAAFPDTYVSISFDVAPEIREYERTSTTVANAYVQPMMTRYLVRLRQQIEGLGLKPRLQVMLSSGGVTTFGQAANLPVRLVESGAAGGAIAASYWGKLAGHLKIVAFDMGGTTAKITLIDGGRPEIVNELEVARLHRLKQGSGLPMKTASIDVIEIGAGGGSIAHLDNLQLLQVGPQSAGAQPGPACYARGGDKPTVTDADLVLGYLDPNYFLGGAMALDRGRAQKAIGETVAHALGCSIEQAAAHIRATVNDGMARALRVHAAERGRDVRGFTLVTFGGAGPTHAYDIARLLRIERILCPFGAGVASALGFAVAPKVVDDVRSYVARLSDVDWTRVNALFAEMQEHTRDVLAQAEGATLAPKVEYMVEMRYTGQTHNITVDLPVRKFGQEGDAADMTRRFQSTYKRRFGHALSGASIETLNWRLRVTVPNAVGLQTLHFAEAGASAARPRERMAFFEEAGGMIPCKVYSRYELAVGDVLAGPALIEERESTFVVGPGAKTTVDSSRNLIVDVHLPASPA